MTWFAVAAAAAAAVSAAITGVSAYNQSKGAAEQANADAEAQKARGRLEAERILKQKTKQQSMARAAAAANGLDVNEGTALKINDEIEKAGQYDAEIARQTGYNASQRLMAQADQYGKNANTALASGALNMVSAGVSAKKGWK